MWELFIVLSVVCFAGAFFISKRTPEKRARRTNYVVYGPKFQLLRKNESKLPDVSPIKEENTTVYVAEPVKSQVQNQTSYEDPEEEQDTKKDKNEQKNEEKTNYNSFKFFDS